MEAELLREMITDRDRRIVLVRQKTHDLDNKEQRLLDDLDEATEASARENITYETEKSQLVQQYQQAQEQLTHMQQDMQNQASSLRSYASQALHADSEATIDSNYVMRMQAQLCKAMHSMGILDHQLTVAQEHAEAMTKLLKEAMTVQREAKAQLELSLLNDLMMADNERREKEAEIKKEYDSVRKQVKQMEREIRENEAESDDDDDNEEEDKKENDEDDTEREDDEEANAKKEMVQLLDQRKQQIKEIETKLDEQEKYLDKLRSERKEDDAVIPETESRPAKEETPEPEDDDDDDDDSQDEEDEEETQQRQAMDERLKQLTENAKLDEVEENVDEMDLLAMVQNRLAGGNDAANEEDEDDEDSDEEEDSEEEDSDDEDVKENGVHVANGD
mmetsp:Transcript_5294/g.14874  ORF Transcript_5294/g.14874 Transcript_5294/m.14874 type:complete len:391 (+) Transcript_5294:157-1329(+)|eukprot:CAMPEP_0168742102 /NCGR_PEP_ID=MMETSP0724-20121128/12863_1 /TAXON_ID=265536 /ORGANISM="Amphiprora sp., Strain CCMP467" /LENGTH=390 /DNA_ID=CAMNT_0008789641 /DNA_START=84 /DNA_END=1256 /DNA_ORIENTATION=+